MDREYVKGAADKAKGAVKQSASKLTGDKELEREGQAGKAKGEVHKAAGNVKDAARIAADIPATAHKRAVFFLAGGVCFPEELMRLMLARHRTCQTSNWDFSAKAALIWRSSQ
jgi:uncharacterized protein YjbJ (UPF0337 family)